MMSGVELTEFLLERLAEDERVARSAQIETRGGEVYPLWAAQDWVELDADVLAHTDRHGPARVLAEMAAKRRIVELHSDDGAGACSTCGTAGEYDVPWPCTTVELLALSFADHRDYRQEWTP